MARNWIATIKEEHWRWNWADPDNTIQYAIWQLEQGKSGYDHYQLYIYTTKKCRFSALKKLFGEGRYEVARNWQACMAYCSKVDTRKEGPYEYGEDDRLGKGQGRRTDLYAVEEAIDEGHDENRIARDHMTTYIKYHAGIRRAIFWAQEGKIPRYRKVHTTVIIGETGVGKTRYVVEKEDPEDLFILSLGDEQNNWFDGYHGQKAILLDDYFGQLKPHFFLRVMDGYKLRLATKGAHTWALWTRVYITSNTAPSRWYKKIPQETHRAICRRMNTIWDMYPDQQIKQGMYHPDINKTL